MHFIANSRYATVRHIQTLEGDEHQEYYAGLDERTRYRVELREMKTARVKALRNADRLGTMYEVEQHDARIAQFEAYLEEVDAYLKSIAPPTRVRDRLDKLTKAGYLRKQSYTGLNSVYWVTQKAIDVFELDAPALTEPSEGMLAHTLAITYVSALIQSGLKSFSARAVSVVLTETQIKCQITRMRDIDPDRERRVQAAGHKVEGYGVPDEATALDIADHYVAGALGHGTHIPDLVLILETGDVLAIEVERTRKNRRELQRVLDKFSRSREKFTRVLYLRAGQRGSGEELAGDDGQPVDARRLHHRLDVQPSRVELNHGGHPLTRG